MTRICREKLGLTSEGVVKKTINKEGKRQVSEPQWMKLLAGWSLKKLKSYMQSDQVRWKTLEGNWIVPQRVRNYCGQLSHGLQGGFPEYSGQVHSN